MGASVALNKEMKVARSIAPQLLAARPDYCAACIAVGVENCIIGSPAWLSEHFEWIKHFDAGTPETAKINAPLAHCLMFQHDTPTVYN